MPSFVSEAATFVDLYGLFQGIAASAAGKAIPGLIIDRWWIMNDTVGNDSWHSLTKIQES